MCCSSTGRCTVLSSLVGCGMSVYDILQSIPIALTTLPIPKDMIYKQFDGIAIGNATSCSIQGVTFLMGAVGAGIYNAIICIYYMLHPIQNGWKMRSFGDEDVLSLGCTSMPYPSVCFYPFLPGTISKSIHRLYSSRGAPIPGIHIGAAKMTRSVRMSVGNQTRIHTIFFLIVNINVLLVAATVVISMVMIIRHVYS